MARRELVNQIIKLYQKLGGNLSDTMGTRTNVNFIGKGEPDMLKMDINTEALGVLPQSKAVEELKESADYSAITTWGVFETEDEGMNIILLNAFKDRYEFPELKKVAHEEYLYWRPDMVIVEAKASGIPLTAELRDMGIPVVNFTPSRGNDKHARVNSVSPLFETGLIWAPMHQHFAQEVVEECAAFPHGDHDDYVDSMTQAIMRIKQGGLVRNKDSYKDEPLPDRSRLEYYG